MAAKGSENNGAAYPVVDRLSRIARTRERAGGQSPVPGSKRRVTLLPSRSVAQVLKATVSTAAFPLAAVAAALWYAAEQRSLVSMFAT